MHFYYRQYLCQNGGLRIINNTNCRIKVEPFAIANIPAIDPSLVVPTICSPYIGYLVIVSSGTTMNFPTACNYESTVGFAIGGGSTMPPVCGPALINDFAWTDFKIQLFGCNTAAIPFYDDNDPLYFDGVAPCQTPAAAVYGGAGPFTCCWGSFGATAPNVTVTSSGIAPEDVIVKVY